jgi:hypothetical protein
MMKATPWHFYHENGMRHRIQANYGVDYGFGTQHRQEPYFSVTGTIDIQARNNRWMDSAGGMLHDEISKRIPILRPYLKWHLVGPEGPMHYFANAKYWFETAQGKEEESRFPTNPIEAFKHTIVLGAFPGDEAPLELQNDLEHAAWRAKANEPKYRGPKEWRPGNTQKTFFRGIPWSHVQAWLEERLPKLQAAWVVDMGELGVLEE